MKEKKQPGQDDTRSFALFSLHPVSGEAQPEALLFFLFHHLQVSSILQILQIFSSNAAPPCLFLCLGGLRAQRQGWMAYIFVIPYRFLPIFFLLADRLSRGCKKKHPHLSNTPPPFVSSLFY